MNKLKILWLSEASFLSTGYATYTKEVLKRLHNTGKYDIVELASYSCQDDERLADIPWKVYPNMPMWKNSPEKNNKQEIEVYDAHPIHQFGSFRFEELCTKFHPNVVVMIRDVWMDSFVISSPFRDNYNILWMPTVDGAPQNPEWMSCYAECDALFTYSDWSIDVLKRQNNRLNILGTASPAADSSFRVLDKKALKQALGLETKKIIGTVMRNQKRKLFPDLFESFRKFLDSSGRTDVLLYCHTSYPDNHPWNIPELLNEHALSNHVLFTYICNNCNYVFPSHFNDYVQICEKCHQAKATTSSVQKGINTEQLVEIYNLFDLYVQYSACEGFGIPLVEAAACGVPVMAVDYSAMSDVVRKLNGIPLTPKAMYKEIETGRMFAVPDNDDTAKKFQELLSDEKALINASIKTKMGYLKHYNYDNTAQKYQNYFDTLDVNALDAKWQKPFIPHVIDTNIPPETVSNSDFVKWLFLNVLNEPHQIGSYLYCKLLKDINYGCTSSGYGLHYLSEDSSYNQPKRREFNRKEAFNQMKALTEFRFHWQRRRMYEGK